MRRKSTSIKLRASVCLTAIAIAALALVPLAAHSSSHREAPLITSMPKVDGTDFYMFDSYESGRAGFVTLVADYQPFQSPFGGPNYFELDPNAKYNIHIDNVGDAHPHITYQFMFTNTIQNLTVPVGTKNIPVPLVNIGQIAANSANPGLNVVQTYTAKVIYSGNGNDNVKPITDTATGSAIFTKPLDNVGMKSIPAYDAYANQYIYDIHIPGCAAPGARMFVGQRKDPFVVNLGDTFDLVNYNNPIGDPAGDADSLFDMNVTSIIMEVPITCLVTSTSQPIIGGWTTAALPSTRSLTAENPAAPAPIQTWGGNYVEVSRLGMPLVNELVIGLKDKNKWNSSQPADDAQFLPYVTHPSVPVLIQALFSADGVKAPTLIPRTDLVATFLTGIKGINQPPNVTPAEELRLNTSTAPTAYGSQNRLGVIAGDSAGFPNGRRPGDDVVDITLQVAMGKLISLGLFGTPAQAPSGNLPFTDQAYVDDTHFDAAFPYVKSPIPGSPNGPTLSGQNGVVPN